MYVRIKKYMYVCMYAITHLPESGWTSLECRMRTIACQPHSHSPHWAAEGHRQRPHALHMYVCMYVHVLEHKLRLAYIHTYIQISVPLGLNR